MVNKVVNVFFVISLLTAMSCASSGGGGTSKSGGKNGGHYEDLSEYRPDFTAAVDTLGSDIPETNSNATIIDVEPTHHITSEINTLLDSINVLKQDIKTVEGYTVQVYTGINREQANEAKATVYKILPDSRPVIIYDQPNFKVKVGQFYTKKEALQTFAGLKRELPAAIIIPERISITNE